ncbi:ABC-type amino acid transport substrate-binding protein [Bradyrhizobium sp. i1.7.7]
MRPWASPSRSNSPASPCRFKEKALQQAILEAVDALIADGTYKTLLAKWKLNDNGLEKATINAGQ